MYGRECTFHFRAEAKPILTSTNRFVMLIANASVLYLNRTCGLIFFTSVVYTLIVRKSTFPIENVWEGMYFSAESKPIMASTNRFIILIENVSVLTLNHTSGLLCFTSVINILMVK